MKIFILIYLFGTAFLLNCSKKEKIQLTGSETLQQTALFLANEYTKQNKKVSIDVFGGGSQEGINKLKNGQTDIALISRELNLEEITFFGDKTSLVTIAYDGAGIIVNPSNNLEGLHLSQISDLFTGKITNWKEVGGEDLPIQIVVRNDMSGTSAFFKEHIVQRKDLGENKFDSSLNYDPNAKIVKDNKELIDIISKNPGSIGYIGMGWANASSTKIKLLKYGKKPEDEKVIPNLENIVQRKYKLARALSFLYMTNNSKVEDFISFCTSESGQQAIQKTGYLRSTLPEVEVKGN
jgi:phosphate transport system substrate-binding protein